MEYRLPTRRRVRAHRADSLPIDAAGIDVLDSSIEIEAAVAG
jgi:hypothetical protein